ncbi:MAG: hypothetical protein LBP55_03600 [Candidatus Adiutrix sp.]|jgi:hypothetical protein|nr:hypothetical protein [Candidatus Adiutrix sp.]
MDFKAINRELLTRLDWPTFLPGGHRAGREFQAADLTGGRGRSFCVNMTNGAWCDNATGEKGRDIIGLVATRWNCGQGEAARRLCDEYGLDPGGQTRSGSTREDSQPGLSLVGAKSPQPGPPDRGFTQLIPPGKPPESAMIINGRKADLASHYQRPADWQTAFYILRWHVNPLTGKGKLILPLSYGELCGVVGWHRRLPPGPGRPLLGLAEVWQARREGDARPVLIVEGEKCYQAAADYPFLVAEIVDCFCIPVTWHGGGGAWHWSDWRMLDGCGPFILWPDADPTGLKAIQGIAETLAAYSENREYIEFVEIKEDWPPKFDLADLIELERNRNGC